MQHCRVGASPTSREGAVITLARIAASYGLEPIELAALVGLSDVDPGAGLRSEQTAYIINSADDSTCLGFTPTGRHRFR